jgi:alpha-beta hydrolase superfamily lysophospholipase
MHDGTQLATLTWPAENAKATVVIVHGLRDHADRYTAFAQQLVADGYSVVAFDLRGHGHSAGPRVYPDDWNDYVSDLEEVLAKLPSDKPIFVFGHSMGGAIVARTAEQTHTKLAGIILSGPALQIDAKPGLIALTKMSGVTSPKIAALDLPTEDFSTDPAMVAAMKADPFVMQTPGPAKTAAGLVAAMSDIWANTDALAMPVLALHGSHDKLTAPAGSRSLVEILVGEHRDATLHIYQGFAHDLLHEPKGQQVADDIKAWLDAHTGGAALPPTEIYAGGLDGEPGKWTQAFSLGAGIAKDSHVALLGSLTLGKLRPIGWSGTLSGYRLGDAWAVSLRPVGIALRAGGFAIGISGGVSLVTQTEGALAGGGFAELPAGPVHVSVYGEYLARSRPSAPGGQEINRDQATAAVSLRLPGDRSYWPHAVAGVGPVITGGLAWFGDSDAAWFATLGLQLYGAD